MIPSVQEDELSCCSTQSVRSHVQPSKYVVSRKRPRCSPRVSFSSSITVFPSNEFVYESELQKLWYNGEDYQQFKANFCLAAKELIRSEKTAAKQIDGEKSYGRVMLRVFKSCCKATFDSHDKRTMDNKLLQEWLSVTSSHRLGLERFAVQKVYKDKAIRRTELLEAILELQSCCRYNKCTKEEQTEIIARMTRKISRPSRLFATLLASTAARV